MSLFNFIEEDEKDEPSDNFGIVYIVGGIFFVLLSVVAYFLNVGLALACLSFGLIAIIRGIYFYISKFKEK